MKNKVLIGVLTVLLVIGMVSCSMDEYAKLGDFMGKMGNNVYGIEPSMKEVDSTTAKIDGSVTKDESGKVTGIDTSNAGDLISGLAEIKNSTQKTNAMKEELSKKVSENKEESDAVKAAMESEINGVISNMPELPADKEIDQAVKDAYDSVNEALKKIQEKVSGTDDPTKADLATVAIVKSLADTVKDVAEKAKTEDVKKEDLIKEADKALQALDALKVAADAAGLGDILGDISISSLLSSSSSSKSIAKAADDSELDATTRLLVQAAEKLVSLVCDDNGSVDAKKYNRVLFQLSAIRTAYEASASFVMPSVSYSDGFGYVDTAFYNGSIGLGRFSANDAVLYTIAFAFTEADSLLSTPEKSFSEFLDSFLTAYASGKDEDIKKVEEDFEEAMKGITLDSSALAKRSAVGVNTLCAILADAKYIDTVKDTIGRDSTLGDSLDDLFKNINIKGESK